MMKFFRKHNKKLLAIFMVLLMIVFVGGTALESLLRPSFNRVTGESRFGKITQADIAAAEEVTRILDTLGIPWRQPLPATSDPLEHADWVLLTREAAALGMASSPAAVRATVGDISDIREVARALRIKPDRVVHALAEWDAVVGAARKLTDSTVPSEAEVRAAARDTLERLRINVAVLPAEHFLDASLTFSEEQIRAQFESHRERKAGEGLEFGYYLDPAIQVQYVRIDREALAENVRVANLANRARTYFDAARSTDPAFHRPHDEEHGADEDHSEHLMDWEEARPIAEAAVRRQEARAVASRIADWLAQYTSEPWLEVERGPDGYKAAPSFVAETDYYQRVIENLPPALAYRPALSVGQTDFFTHEAADAVAEIGGARHLPEGSPVPQTLGSLAFQNRFLVPQVPDDRGVNPSDYLSPFQTCRYPLSDNEGNLYVFRVIGFREGRVPDTVDEARERVVRDLRLKAAFEAALRRAESLRGCSVDDVTLREAHASDAELAALAASWPGGDAGYFEVERFPRRTRAEAASGRPQPSRYVGPGAGFLSSEVIDRLFALARTGEQTAVIELPERAAVMVVEFVELLPVPAEEFYNIRDEFVSEMMRQRSVALASDWLDPENIRARTGFKLATN